jgi:hypothetical protein
MSNDKQFIDFKKEVEKLKEIDGAEEYAKQLAHLFLGNGLSLQTILLMAIDYGMGHQNWISVKDELPENDGGFSDEVFVYGRMGYSVARYSYISNCWSFTEFSDDEITHWMKPIEPRKEDRL